MATAIYDVAVLIGRFQPLHQGHVALLHEALARAHRVVVIVGSAYKARTPKNPFTWQERAQLLRQALPPSSHERLSILPLRDLYNQTLWAQAVRATVDAHCAPGARIALVGHLKDTDTAHYLQAFAFPDWDLVSLPRQGPMDATLLRQTYWSAHDTEAMDALAPLVPLVPPVTLAFLKEFAQTHPQTYRALQHEWRVLRDYRASWAQAPYPPIFVTVDAVVRCQDHVLLVRRARAPGVGLWALPGGFVEPRDTLWQSCLRELREETLLDLPEATLAGALRAVRVFDHPDRSQRGRTITHAHSFDLGAVALPRVEGGDDAAQAQWMPLDSLEDMETLFFEDHFHILRQFIPC